MRRPALILLSAALAVAGCGSSADGDNKDEQPAPIAAQSVVQEFSEVPGMPELVTAVPDPAWEQLGPGLDIPPAAQERYGTFTIYVVDPEDPEAVKSLLADKDTAKPLQADADGIYWDYDELAKSYVAQKRYGSNVVLAWWNEQREQGTDERWERLDGILHGLVSG
jgi:nitrous oxide reductase accessory protein NosL